MPLVTQQPPGVQLPKEDQMSARDKRKSTARSKWLKNRTQITYFKITRNLEPHREEQEGHVASSFLERNTNKGYGPENGCIR